MVGRSKYYQLKSNPYVTKPTSFRFLFQTNYVFDWLHCFALFVIVETVLTLAALAKRGSNLESFGKGGLSDAEMQVFQVFQEIPTTTELF